MRIGLIVPGFSSHAQDWCIPALRNLVCELAARHDVHVFALRYPHRWESYRVAGATVHALGGGVVRGLRRGGILARAFVRIAAVHRRQRLDVVHGFWADEPGFLAVSVDRLLGIPATVSLMGGELARLPDIGYGGQLGRVGRVLIRHALRHARRVTVGSGCLEELLKATVDDPLPVRLPLGVDVRLFHPDRTSASPARLGEDGLHLLNVASLIPVKNQAMLLEAFSLLAAHRADARLHIVGEGPLRGKLEQRAASLAISDRVTFHGAVPHHELPDYYRAADLCVLSSRFESQGLVVLEAAACGRATVGTAVGILPELGRAARAVPVGHVHSLADAIAETLREPGRAAAMGRSAHDTVIDGLTIQRTAETLEAIYAETRAR